MKFGFKRRLVKGAPVEDCGPVRVSHASGFREELAPYNADELERIMDTVRPLTLEETQLAARNRRESAADRASMEAWYQAEVR